MFRCTLETPVGPMLAASDGEALTGLWFLEQKYYPAAADTWEQTASLPIFDALNTQLALYFDHRLQTFTLPLAPDGGAFRQDVWQLLKAIPFGGTATYGSLARSIAASRGVPRFSAQAVGGAVGHNPISIIIPCHRVMGANGSLTGYAGGLWRKEALLRLEGILV